MTDLNAQEREAMEAAQPKLGAFDGALAQDGFRKGWLAARDYLDETVIVPLGVRLNDAERDRETAEDRIRVLEDALKQIAGRRRLNPAPGYEHVPLVAVEMARIANDAVRRAALSTSVGSSDAEALSDGLPAGFPSDHLVEGLYVAADRESTSDAGANSDAGKLGEPRTCPVCRKRPATERDPWGDPICAPCIESFRAWRGEHHE